MKQKILVVDDDPVLRSMMCEVLETNGYETDSADGGAEALMKLQRDDFNLLVTDVVMHGINGIELVMRAHKLLPRLEAIVLSGEGTEATRNKLTRLGVYGFLEKPVQPENLVDMVKMAVKSDRVVRLGYDKKDPVLRFNKERILVADDNREFLDSFAEIMEQRGYIVKAVGNGSEAYENILINDYDMIILDINMPKMDGVETVKAIREHDSHTYILLISGEAESREIQEAMENGANKFMAKPFRFEEFFALVAEIDFKAIYNSKFQDVEESTGKLLKQRSLSRRISDFWKSRRMKKRMMWAVAIIALCFGASFLTFMASNVVHKQNDDSAFIERMDQMIDAIRQDWGR